eukprot:2265790-Rhodomonas_salina.1
MQDAAHVLRSVGSCAGPHPFFPFRSPLSTSPSSRALFEQGGEPVRWQGREGERGGLSVGRFIPQAVLLSPLWPHLDRDTGRTWTVTLAALGP